VLIFSGCSTPQSQRPRELTFRNVTAACPEPDPIIDRNFSAEPPACLAKIREQRFRYDTDAGWLAALAASTGAVIEIANCARLAAEWVDDERETRNMEGAD
jgi:hypothetical protein